MRETPSMWPEKTGVPSVLSVPLSGRGPSAAQPFLPELSATFPETQPEAALALALCYQRGGAHCFSSVVL